MVVVSCFFSLALWCHRWPLSWLSMATFSPPLIPSFWLPRIRRRQDVWQLDRLVFFLFSLIFFIAKNQSSIVRFCPLPLAISSPQTLSLSWFESMKNSKVATNLYRWQSYLVLNSFSLSFFFSFFKFIHAWVNYLTQTRSQIYFWPDQIIFLILT